MIKINEIKKQYKDFSLNCTMEINDGCITGLIGQNGAVKLVQRFISTCIFTNGDRQVDSQLR